MFNEPEFLEELTGLAELQRQTAAMFIAMEDEEDNAKQGGDSDDDWAEL